MSIVGYSQSTKQIEKATKVFYKDYTKGIAKLRKYMQKADNPSLLAYEVLVKMEYLDYERSVSVWEGIEFKNEDGEVTNDSSMQAMVDELKEFSKQHFVNVCRRSTIESYSYTADTYLRILLVDEDPDSAISEAGKEFFDNGEQAFVDEKFEEAEGFYRKALNEDPTYYKAILYIGDTYWVREQPDSALLYYERARDMHPKLLEPRKYIVDALIDQGLYYRAKKECLAALCVYPGFDMKMKMQRILEVENKWMNDQRFIRFFYPNNYQIEEQRDLFGIWDDYRNSKYKIDKYADEDGIIEENGITDEKYLEIYSLRTMLNKHKDKQLPPYLQFALKMDEEGYFEPYVFISLFHVDIYPQFEHYMSFEENRVKTIDFIEKYLIVRVEK
jgi:tetratricopeptide (TPR) repeat protein